MTVSITKWAQSVDYRVVYESSTTNTANNHVTGTSGRLYSIIVNNLQGTDECFLKIEDALASTPGSSEPTWRFRCASAKAETFEIPGGAPFTEGLSFWLTRNEATTDTTAPAVSTNGTVKVTLLASSS